MATLTLSEARAAKASITESMRKLSESFKKIESMIIAYESIPNITSEQMTSLNNEVRALLASIPVGEI